MSTVVNAIVETTGTKEAKTKFGTKPTYSFKVGGEWYSTGFKKHGVVGGDMVSFDFTETKYGKEVDVGSIKKSLGAVTGSVGGVPPSRPAPTFGSKGSFPIPALDGQRAIVRQNALTNARELISTLIGTTKEGTWADRQKQFDNLSVEIIRIARKFEAYSCGDLDMAEAKADMARDEDTQ